MPSRGFPTGRCIFFSSRRRHTRCGRDWSSDVCSSDLPAVRLPGHGVQLDSVQQAVRARIETALADGGTAVLSEADLARLGADRRLTAALVRQGVLVTVASGLHLGGGVLEQAVATLHRAFPDGRTFTAAEAKEALGTTRKTAIPLL